MEIAIISDTHMPRGGRVLPAACVRRLVRADLILHAGDFTRLSVLQAIERHGQVLAVHGNVDDEELRSALPASRVVEVGGSRVGLVHDAGPARGRLERLRAMFPDVDAVVFGHSHMPLHERSGDGFQIFNPGSPTERRGAPRCTMGIARIRGGALSFELAELG